MPRTNPKKCLQTKKPKSARGDRRFGLFLLCPCFIFLHGREKKQTTEHGNNNKNKKKTNRSRVTISETVAITRAQERLALYEDATKPHLGNFRTTTTT